MINVIETELFRKKLYDNILTWLSGKLNVLKYKEVYNILLRYIFNKNISRTQDDDPVFITTFSELAYEQFRKDMEYNNITLDYKELIKELEYRIQQSSEKIKNTPIRYDKAVQIVQNSTAGENTLVYRCKKYRDISRLAEKYPAYINNAVALNIRYTYLHLHNHGLARNFREEGFKPDDCILEGFASAFNHYFDNYCSAFPDLESPFGSKGSFFDNKDWNYNCVFINPPFD